VARPPNIDTKGRIVVSCKWYILYCACSLSLLKSYLLDLPRTAAVLTPICAEGLGVGPLVLSAYREPTLVNYLQSNAPSPFKSSSTHKISAKALAVEIWVLARPLPNGRETQDCRPGPRWRLRVPCTFRFMSNSASFTFNRRY